MKMPCHLLLGKLAESFPSHVLAALDSLVPALHATLTARVKQEAVKQEVCCCLAPDLLGWDYVWLRQALCAEHGLHARGSNSSSAVRTPHCQAQKCQDRGRSASAWSQAAGFLPVLL